LARRRKGDPISGWVCLDKPDGLGSTQAVARVRRAFNARKAGHAGTLDPLATGVLPIALGEATKTASYLTDAKKTYRFTIAWGVATATFDREGETTATSPARPDADRLRAALETFVGELEQVPPDFSAVKVMGARAYDLARQGVAMDLSPRKVVIYAARLLGRADEDHAEVEIECGRGTYVRALVRDLALALGTVAHVSALRRTRVGAFTEARALGLELVERLCHTGAPLEALLPVETPLDDIPAVAVTTEETFRLTQGRSIVLLPRQVETLKAAPGASRLVSALHGGRLVALCEMRAGRLDPMRVFHLT
jgi:tRNA pseudouridine55 synthase